MNRRMLAGIWVLISLASMRAQTPSTADMAALKGLAPVTVLAKTPAGQAALGANLTVTGGIQTGAIAQPTLLPFAEQQQQALRDAFITSDNLAELSDGLGTTLGSAYLARFHYIDRTTSTPLPQAVADLLHYAEVVTGLHANEGKYLFANATTDGSTSVPAAEAALVTNISGTSDVFGQAYNLKAGSTGADPFGNSRPFQTEPNVTMFIGNDYFNTPSSNFAYNHGPVMNLLQSPSYPSGHTTYGYTGIVLLAVLVPERYAQMIARGAEYGNDRIIMGAHYTMDVLGGRTLALYDMAHLLANDPAYLNLNLPLPNIPPIKDFQAAVKNARTELLAILQQGCGKAIEECAREDTGRFSNAAANEAFYASTQTYNLPVVYATTAAAREDVGKLAPEAGYLLKAAFPSLTIEEADRVLTETEGPGGGFLDNGSAFGVYSRLNLYAAGRLAEQRVAGK